MIIADAKIQRNTGSTPAIPPGGCLKTFRNEMRIRNYSLRTIKTYSSMLRAFISYIRPTRPRDVQPASIRQYILTLADERHLSFAPVNQTINALRFLYKELLGHTRLETTQIYARVRNPRLLKVRSPLREL